MSLYKSSQTDPNKEKDGVPLEYGLNSKKEPITFTVAREGGRNVQYQKVAEHIFKPFRRQIQHGQIDPEVLENLLAQVYAKAVVKGWSGVEDEHDEPLEFNEANVQKLLTDLPVVFDAIKEVARDYNQFLLESLEEDAKN